MKCSDASGMSWSARVWDRNMHSERVVLLNMVKQIE
jgi:hypothetical protein